MIRFFSVLHLHYISMLNARGVVTIGAQKDNHEIYLLNYLCYTTTLIKALHFSHSTSNGGWLISENGIYDYDLEL